MLGCDVGFGSIHLVADAAFEHYFNPPAGYVADALLFSLGASRAF